MILAVLAADVLHFERKWLYLLRNFQEPEAAMTAVWRDSTVTQVRPPAARLQQIPASGGNNKTYFPLWWASANFNCCFILSNTAHNISWKNLILDKHGTSSLHSSVNSFESLDVPECSGRRKEEGRGGQHVSGLAGSNQHTPCPPAQLCIRTNPGVRRWRPQCRLLVILMVQIVPEPIWTLHQPNQSLCCIILINLDVASK